MRRFFFAVFLALPFAIGLSSCKKAEAPAVQAPSTETKSYHGHGEVLGFQADGRVILLKHDKIEGFMDAMTMGFELKDPAAAKVFKKGDRVDFELEVANDSPLITKVTKAAH